MPGRGDGHRMGMVGRGENHAALEQKQEPAPESRTEPFQIFRASLVEDEKEHQLRRRGLGGDDARSEKGGCGEKKPDRAGA